MRKSLALVSALLAAAVALAQTATTTDLPGDPRVQLRQVLCGSQGMPPTSTEIPTIGCFAVPSGGSARGVFDGHQFIVAVGPDGKPQCSFDGAQQACYACIPERSPECPVVLVEISRNSDKSVSFSVKRKADGNRYVFRIDAWNSYLEHKQIRQGVAATQAPPVAGTLPPGAVLIPPPMPQDSGPPPPPGLIPGSIVPTDGPAALSAVGWNAQGAYASGQFARLDALIETLSQPDQLTDDGLPRSQGVLLGLEQFMQVWKKWEMDFDRVAEWHKEEPDSYAADLAEVIVWRMWAWHARGEGFASTVTPEGWKLFSERLAHAQQVLDRCKARAMKSPLWYQLSLVIARDSGWDTKRYRAMLDEATSRFPWYVTFYTSTSKFLSPKWGGSYEALDEFARQTERTRLGSDHSLYTRVYWSLTDEARGEFDPFRDSQADWKLMKAGFEGLMKRYPKSKWNLNAYAYFACRANDGSTYGALRARIGQDVIPEAWADNYPTEVCDERLLGRT